MGSESFSQSITLKTHKLGVHEKLRTNCDLCSKSFFYKGNLLQHIRYVHDKMRL